MTSSGGASFSLATQPANYSAAQAACQAGGGHLARYASLTEQQEVEAFYIGSGVCVGGGVGWSTWGAALPWRCSSSSIRVQPAEARATVAPRRAPAPAAVPGQQTTLSSMNHYNSLRCMIASGEPPPPPRPPAPPQAT
jgi:hypothetical protein